MVFQVTDHVYSTVAQTYSSVLDQQLMPGGQYELYIQFVGQINDHMQGFYRSSYFDPETGQKRYGQKCCETWT
jgi:puromycin-sensitive aminopeptidase/aminopeptidase N/glutamyl aminopeptidase/endoplasmic reticulum aminopeptidase 2